MMPSTNPFAWEADKQFPTMIYHLVVFGTKTTTFVFFSKQLKAWFVSHLGEANIGTASFEIDRIKRLAEEMFRESVRKPVLISRLVAKKS